MATQAAQSTIIYPESDGEPMGETDAHVTAIVETMSTLRNYFRSNPTVFVGGDMMMYYREGDTSAVVSPDTFVIFGVPNHTRRTYRFWEEGVPPTVAFEYTSRSTRRADTHTKVALYAELGIQEYILFDPLSEYLKPSLQGYRLVGGRYQPMELGVEGWLVSEILGVSMRHEGMRLRMVETATGTPLLVLDEAANRLDVEIAAREQAEARLHAEAAAREKAEAELAALRAELARLRGES